MGEFSGWMDMANISHSPGDQGRNFLMTPDQVKKSIQAECDILLDRANKGVIRHECIYGIISSRCKEGAMHNGVPNLWMEYLPESLIPKIGVLK